MYYSEVEDHLEHFGVKGMKWGVRKSEDTSSRSRARAAKKAEKADTEWLLQYSTKKIRIAVYNDVADQMNANLGPLNAKYAGKDIVDWSKGDGAKYIKEVQAMALSAAENSVKKLIPDSPSGRLTTRVEYNPLEEMLPRVYVVDKAIKHSDEPSFSEMEIVAVWKNNRIVAIKIPDLSEVDEYLTHYGVKGMKWGKRKTQSSSKLALRDARVDRKEVKRLSKTTYKGILADRRAAKVKIKDRIASDPEYAKAVETLNRRSRTRGYISATAVMVGLTIGPILVEMYGPQLVSAAVKGSVRTASAAANSDFARRAKNKARYSPNSPFWDGVTVPGATVPYDVVSSGMELVRRYR